MLHGRNDISGGPRVCVLQVYLYILYSVRSIDILLFNEMCEFFHATLYIHNARTYV
jgi:hypothetical protein